MPDKLYCPRCQSWVTSLLKCQGQMVCVECAAEMERAAHEQARRQAVQTTGGRK